MMKRIPLEITVALLLIISVLIMLSAGYLTYRNMSSMVNSILSQTRPDMSLVNLKEISSSLNDADNNIRLYMVTGDKGYLDPYEQVVTNLDSSIDLLYQNTDSPRQHPLIDSVSQLISEKIEVWEQLLDLRGNHQETSALDILQEKFLTNQPADSADTTVQEKHNILQRLFRKKKEEKQEPSGINPSVLQEELSQIEKLQQQDSLKMVQKQRREIDLLRKDRKLTSRLTLLINTLEERENISFRQKALEADQSAALTYRWLVIFGISVFLMLLIVLIVIINYVRKTNATRMALLEAKNEAEDLARAKEVFVANVSHEIRSPMYAIYGLSEQLLQLPSDDKMKEQLEVIRKSSDHLLGVINEILDFSKLQAGKIRLESIDFYLTDVIEEVMQVSRVLAEKKQLVTSFDIKPGVPEMVQGDPVRLKQILHNLLSNAVKFTEYGKVTLEVSGKEKDENLVLIEMCVSDTGIGIDQDKQEEIFEDFTQEETSTTRQFGGTGLGLSIVKRLVDLMEGTIRVESRKGVGTSFIADLPFKLSKHVTPAATKPDLSRNEIPDFSGLSILVAEDEEYNKVLLRMIFNKWRVHHTEVSNGKEAVEEAGRKRYDIILMDIRMPVMDGITATRKIMKNYEAGNSPAIVGVSATSANKDIRRCREAGMSDFLSKPYREEALRKVLLRVHGNVRSRSLHPVDDQVSENQKKLDLQELYHLGDGDEKFIYDLLDVFIRNSSDTLKIMEEAIKAGEWEKTADAAHRLASPVLHLRAYPLHSLLKKIEDLARNVRDTDKIPELFSRALKERDEITVLIQAHMKEMKRSPEEGSAN